MDPADTFHGAILSVWGRAMACGVAILAPYLFLGLYAEGAALFPIVVLYSVATGWGLIVYTALLIFYTWFVSGEAPYYLLGVPLVISGMDLWRVVLEMKTLLN